MMNVVIDTNCLLMSLSRRSPYYKIWHSLKNGHYVLCYTNDILTEYEEILTNKMGPEIANNIISAILNLPNTKQVQTFFHLHLITADPDDDKFVDCAFKTRANFIVSQDHHYNVLYKTGFPNINVISIDKFLSILNSYYN